MARDGAILPVCVGRAQNRPVDPGSTEPDDPDLVLSRRSCVVVGTV